MSHFKKLFFVLVFAGMMCAVSVVYAQTMSFDSSNSTGLSNSTQTLNFGFSNATQIILNSKTLDIKTDKSVYQYGETIKLTLEDFNIGQNIDMTNFENDYPGIITPCGIEYTSFVFLPGIWSNVTNYDQLVAQQSKSLNVLYGIPYKFYSCPGGYIKQINHVNMIAESHNATVTWTDAKGQVFSTKPSLFGVYDIRNIYSETDLYKETSSGIKFPYRENSTLPSGNYTIIGFDLSGKVSTPLVLQVLNPKNQTQAQITETSQNPASFMPLMMLNMDTKILPQAAAFLLSASGLLLTMSLFGISLVTSSYKKSSWRFYFLGVFLIAMLVFNPINSNQASATYIKYESGIALIPAQSSRPYTAVVQVETQGISTDFDTDQGFSVQNNQFITNSNIPNYLWSQSTLSVEIPDGTSFNDVHNCSTQNPSFTYSCKLPQVLSLTGDYQFWTASVGGSNPCPSGWTLLMTESVCYLIEPPTSPITPSIDNTILGVDLYTYQQINSDGTISMVQKYRLCTSLPCSGDYHQLQLQPFQSPVFANSPPSSYFGDGNSRHSSGDIVAECSTCDIDKFGLKGTSTFYEGTYASLLYQINDLGNADFDQPSPISETVEMNRNLLWWDSISSATGSTSTFTNTVIHGCAPLPSGFWAIQYNCSLRNTFTAPNDVEIGGTSQQPTLLTIPNQVTLLAHLKQYEILIDPGMGILVQPGGSINTS